MTFQWEQRADYVNACNAQAPPGVLPVYSECHLPILTFDADHCYIDPPRPVGRDSVTDVTDFHYGYEKLNVSEHRQGANDYQAVILD